MKATSYRGVLSFVLHSHLPYARRAGRWPHGEEWVHEAATECYLPLLQQLDRLAKAGTPFALTIGITPVLAEQLADPHINEHLEAYLEDKVGRAEGDVRRFARLGDVDREDVAVFHRDRYSGLRRSYVEEYGRDIIGQFRRLQDAGCIEVATSAATHGYLPLLATDESIRGQVESGVSAYVRHFGKPPVSFWMPECAYRPAYQDDDEGLRPGIETFLEQAGVRVTFSETHLVEGGRPVGKAAGDAIGPYGEIKRRYAVPTVELPPLRSTYQPYTINESTVSVLGRNNRTGLQVWSASHGYPGDYWYREFHKKDGESGLHYWRVTGSEIDLGEKEVYRPAFAAGRAAEHAEHFARLCQEQLDEFYDSHETVGVISGAYDTELFGHWWMEGSQWLGQVLENLANNGVRTMSAGQFIREHPPAHALALPEGSWGNGGTHFTWLNPDTEWTWPEVHQRERLMRDLATTHVSPAAPARGVLDQLARELLLLQSSDWQFLITTGQARQYAIDRFISHCERFDRLAECLAKDTPEAELVSVTEELFEQDNLFPDIDYRLWARDAAP
jgi:1,4-alpha-glucan branching enzyme